MNNNTQSRTGATRLVSLFVAFGVSIGVVGCSTHPTTTTGSSTVGEASSSVSAQSLVDVEAVWASHPMPDCPRVIVGNASAPAGLELPSDESVAREFQGVMSPAPESWVRTKLGWVTMWLSKTRADLIAFSDTPGGSATTKQFDHYVAHVNTELATGHDVSDSALDSRFPDGCA